MKEAPLVAPGRPSDRAKTHLRLAGQEIPVGPVELLVVQPSPFCNIDCRYCYLPDRKNSARMSAGTLRALALRLAAAPELLGSVLSVSWHAGEPLAVPMSFYEEAFSTLREVLGERTRIVHSFQTNATLLDEEWLRFIARERVHVGVSLDGPAELHDKNRVYRSGKGTHAAVMRGVALLQSHKIPFNVIAVVTRHALSQADALYDFFRDAGIRRVGLNIEEVELHHVESSLDSGTQGPFSDFLGRLFARSLADDAVRFRELNAIRNIVARDDARPDRYAQLVRPFGVLTCDVRGNISSFSPELCGAKSKRYADFTVGNVHDDSLVDMLNSAAMSAMAHDIQRGIARCETSCGYYGLCGGGAPANKFFEHGTLDATETMYCQHSRQAVIDAALRELEQHALQARA